MRRRAGDEPRPRRAADAGRRHSRRRRAPLRAPLPARDHGQPPRPSGRPQPVGQRFEAAAPDQVWPADTTYLPTGEGWLYLAAVLDLATRKAVGWPMREHLRAELARAAPMMATRRQRPAPGLLQHSDRGSQCAAADYRKLLGAAGMRQSMGRRANCYDCEYVGAAWGA